jgi:hypothetical protein
MIEQLKEMFSWTYKRFEWGYKFGGSGVQLFNFVGILTLLVRGVNNEFSRWILVPLFLAFGLIVCVGIGWFMFDVLKLKTKFAQQEGMRDEYWTHRLTPKEQKIMLTYLDAINNPKKIKELKQKIKCGCL